MRLFAAVAALALLTGCASLPTALNVQSGPELEVLESQEFAYYSPAGPAAQATPADIVSGFLNAGTGPQNDYAIAREFLTDTFATSWRSGGRVLIRGGAPRLELVSRDLVAVEIPVVARIDDNGRYLVAAPGEVESLRYRLVQEAGEWRISSAPSLTVVTPPVFEVVFQAYPVYYLDPAFRYLVPDLRWFPSRISTATRLVNALLAGPSDWLDAAVRSAIPAETRLTVDAVRVVDGVALVDFDASALSALGQQRQLMLAQLEATLTQLPTVTGVAISVNNNQQEITSARLLAPAVNGSIAAATESGLFRLTGSAASVIAGAATPIIRTQANQFDVNADGSLLALGSERGIYLSRLNGLGIDLQLVDDRPGLLAPQFDADGFLWSVPQLAGADIRVVTSFGSATLVSQQGDPTERAGFEISPEGTRIVEIRVVGDTRRVAVSGVVRDAAGTPRAISASSFFANLVGVPISVSWSDASTVLVLERMPLGNTILNRYPLSGPREQLPNPPVPGIAAHPTNSGASNYLLTESGQIWVLTGTSWRQIYSGAIAIGRLD